MDLKLTSFKSSCPFKVETHLDLRESFIDCQFIVIGQINTLIDLSEPSPAGKFQDGLWRATCFEMFLDQGTHYIEWNIARNQSWACYEFKKYREKTQDLRNMSPFDYRLQQNLEQMKVQFKLPYSGQFKALSPCCILKLENSCFFFANRHLGKQPDFHLRESFVSL